MKEFNINSFVRVKLTETGKKYMIGSSGLSNSIQDGVPMDEDGYTTLPLWFVMHMFNFGSGMIEENILILDEDLKDVVPTKNK